MKFPQVPIVPLHNHENLEWYNHRAITQLESHNRRAVTRGLYGSDYHTDYPAKD